MRRILWLLLAVASVAQLPAATTTSITQFGVTFNFESAVEYGTFANGDYWFVVPGTITSITPAAVDLGGSDGWENGWEVNPTVQASQGFDQDGQNFSAALMPSLPYVVSSARSIVKVISGEFQTVVDSELSTIKTSVVLTALDSAPPDSTGAGYFRPPYIGTSKPLYAVEDLRTELLPSLPSVGVPPSLASVVSRFSQCLRMDHHPTFPRTFRPSDAMYDYQPQNTEEVADALLRLMLDDVAEDKEPLLIQMVQHGIDRAYAIMGGYRHGSTGHNTGQRILAGFAAEMLDIQAVRDYLASASGLHEERFVKKPGSLALWGESSSEFQYWNYVMTAAGSRSNADPYGLVDGGSPNRPGYQILVSQALKDSALIATLMPELQSSFQTGHFDILQEYAERWVETGRYYSPDPAAPYDGNTANYGDTFGPNPSPPPSYVEGAGRFLAYHGIDADGGQYKSNFVAAMWDAYFDAPQDPDEGVLQFSAATYSIDEDGVGTVTLTVTRTGGSAGAVGISYASANGTATAGSDYTSVDSTLAWDDAETTSKTFAVTIADDGDSEGNETFTVTLSSPTGGATLGSLSVATVTIVDDDTEPEVPLMGTLSFEADAGLVESPMADGGDYVSQSVTTSDPAQGGRVRWRVTIPSTGDYTVSVSATAAAFASDTFFLEFDGEPTSPSDIVDLEPIVGDGETAIDVTHRGTGSSSSPEFAPRVWTLSAGEHTLYLRGREASTQIHTLTIEAVAASDTTAPTPDPMTFSLEPVPAGATDVIMEASLASDPSGPVEYMFDETSGNPGGTDSSWQTSRQYQDTGLTTGVQYSYRVKARDSEGNETEWSDAKVVTPEEIPPEGRATASPIIMLP